MELIPIRFSLVPYGPNVLPTNQYPSCLGPLVKNCKFLTLIPAVLNAFSVSNKWNPLGQLPNDHEGTALVLVHSAPSTDPPNASLVKSTRLSGRSILLI